MKILKTILLAIAVFAISTNSHAQTCYGLNENDFPQTCVSTEGSAPTNATFDYDYVTGSPATGYTGGADGTNDVTVTMDATCNFPNGTNGSTYIAACLGPDGLDSGHNGANPACGGSGLVIPGTSDFGGATCDDQACAVCYVTVCYDFINGYSSEAAGFDAVWSSMNGSTEGYEAVVGWVEGTDNAGTPLATNGTTTAGLNSWCHSDVLAGTLPINAIFGAAPPVGTFSADAITGDGVATACPTEEPASSSGPDSGGSAAGVAGANLGLNADDIITRMCVVYILSNNNADDCDADGETSVNTNPSGSFASVDICPPTVEVVVECGACTEGAAGLVITELSYDPATTQGNDGDCEYIELFNSYSNTITLDANTTLELSNGASYTFPAGTTIAPGEYIIIAINPTGFGTCTWATPPPAGVQIFGPTSGSLSNSGESVDITLACATNPAIDFTQSVAFSDGTTPTAGGQGDAVYYPLDGTGPLAGAPTPGTGDCAGCAATEFNCTPVACAIEADLMTAPTPPTVTESTCQADGTTVDGGVVDPITCPAGATAEYSIDGGATWTTTVPAYDQTNSITVTVRCLCDEDMTTASPTAEVTTVPGVCASTCAIEANLANAPDAPVVVESTCQADGSTVDGGSISAITCPTGATAEYSTDGGTTWTTTVPTYNQTTAVSVSVRCLCDEDMSTASPVTTVATAPGACSGPACDISNVVFTQNCTGNGDEYELCVSFNYTTPGATGQFQIYLDPAGTGTPATIVAGPYNYVDYDAAIAGGATCFAIPVADYAGDATDLEAGLEVCVGDVDAPAPGTGLPPGSTPPPGGIPTFACPQIYGILHNACAPDGGDEGPNEFVVIVNGADPTPVSSIVVDTPSGSDYDDFNTVTPPPSWICPCCVYLDETGTIPAGGVVVATSAANVSTLDFTSLCATAGTIYVVQDDGVGTTGHFSNSGPRATLLDLTGTASCDGITSYSYINSDGNDGDYTTFSGPDNPGVTAPGSTIGTPNPGNIDSTGECTPQIAPASEVECFACTTLDETTCVMSAECPAVAPVDGADAICDGSLAAEITTWQASVEADATNTTAIADANTDAAVIYSTDAPAAVAEATPPTAGTATGVHSGADLCVAEEQLTYAYLLCYGVDGVAGGGDDIYALLGTHTFTVNPLPQEPTIIVTQGDPECTYVVVGACGDETVGTLANEACGTPAIADISTTVTTAAGCTADFILIKPECEACGAVCAITGLTATPVCNDDGTYCLSVDLTVTTPGASGQYTLNINGTTFGPYNYADLPETAICDASFIGDGETGISITATDADNTGGGGGTGGLYISSVLPDPDTADGNGSGTVDSCDEYIVITNSSANPIDVSGYEIWDDASGGTPRYTFPAGTIIPAGGTIIIYTSDIAGMADGCTGVWNNGGDVIYLYSDSGVTLVDSQTYTGSANDEIITFADPNGGGGTACSAMATFDELVCATAMCPVAASANNGISVCSGDPITALADWQAAVDAANPLDTTQDPDGLGTIEYSSTPDDMSGTWMPDGDVSGITGLHGGADVCTTEDQIVYAYLFCSDDNTYQEIGSLAVTVYPLIEDAVTLNNDGGCCPSVTVACPDYLVSNDYDGNEATPDCSAETSTGSITFNIELAIDPIGGACAFYQTSATFDCTVPTCQITPDMATNIVCNDNGTPDDPNDDTYTFDITVNGNSTFPGASNTFNDDQGNTGIAYGSTVSYGPFPIAGGNVTVLFTDADEGTCTGMMMAAAPATCSNPAGACSISPDMAANIVCNDNGTPTDPSDDTYTFDITVNGSNTFPGASNTFNDDMGNSGIAYGSTVSYGPFPIAGGNVTVNFTDADETTCTGMMMAAAPATCSTDVVCEDEISGTVFTPPGCDANGIEVTVYDNMGNVVATFTTDVNGVYDSTPTVYPCGSYTVGLTNNIPQCYIDASGEVDPKPFVIDGDDNNTDTDGQNFMPNGIPTLSQWGLICLALLLMVYGALMIGARSTAFEKY